MTICLSNVSQWAPKKCRVEYGYTKKCKRCGRSQRIENCKNRSPQERKLYKRRLQSMWNKAVSQVRQPYGKSFCESFKLSLRDDSLSVVWAERVRNITGIKVIDSLKSSQVACLPQENQKSLWTAWIHLKVLRIWATNSRLWKRRKEFRWSWRRYHKEFRFFGWHRKVVHQINC